MGNATVCINHITLGTYFARCSIDEPVEEAKQLIKDNAGMLLLRVNMLIDALGWGPVHVTSGYRNHAYNKKIGGAPNSHHCYGRAIDLADKSGKLYEAIKERPELLRAFGLWMEDRSAAKTWVHLDIGQRPDREIRIFKP